MNKVLIGVVVLAVVVLLVFTFSSGVDLAPKSSTQNIDSSSANPGNNNFLAMLNNTNSTANRTGIVQPYFCGYIALGGSGGGCHPSIPCSCTDTDNGDAPCIFGVVNWTVNNQTNIFRDSCRDNMTLDEYNCGNNGTIGSTTYRCPNGCSNGVCL